MYKPKKQPVVPRLSNLGCIVEIAQPLSCRSQRSPQIAFIQNAIKTSRQKENTMKFIKQQSKSNNTSLQKQNQKPQQLQSSQSILNALRKESTHTPPKTEDQDLYYQIIKQRTAQKKQHCHHHQNKKAKFFIHPKDKLLLCSVCAIQEAYDGKAIIWDIESNEQIPKRLSDDEWSIHNNYPQTSDKYRKVQQLQEFLSLARTLFEAAQKNKDKQIQNHNINDIMEEIQSISKDIVGNVPNIIANLDQRPFQLIMQNYVTKLQQFETILNQQLKTKQPKQIYISFQNKDSFISPDQLISTDSLILRQSEQQKYLNEFNEDINIYSPTF